MTRTPQTVSDVVACNLCTGCGACAGLFPNAIKMIDDEINGRRPVVAPGDAADSAAMAVCGGIGADLPAPADEVEADWGPVLDCWEGYAADPEIRFRGSSGGAVTALATFALTQGTVEAVAHVAARAEDPRFNDTVLSTTPEGLLRAAGSRYAQASPGEAIAPIQQGTGPVAVIGKPCDIASIAKARSADPEFAAKTPLTIAIFCAGAPTLSATEALLNRLDVPKGAKLTDLRYRGDGWPGLMQARWLDDAGQEQVSEGIPYAEGWGRILQAGRRWRCRICDDHTGALADISVGDPWHNPPKGNTDAGRSLIVARTAAGRDLIKAAIAAGVLIVERRDRDVIAKAQPNLLATNAAVWGRRAAMGLIGLPVPAATTASSFATWNGRLSVKAKFQSIAGTLRRIFRDRVHRPVRLTPVKVARGA